MWHTWIIFGPTATGKTTRALVLAREKQADILSFDSRQIYRGMAIGTGQDIPPSYQQDQAGVWRSPTNKAAPALYGLNIINPDKAFSIRHYYDWARPIIEQHRHQQHPLVLVGGAWPYAQVLIDPPATLYQPVNQKLRQELALLDVASLQIQLKQLNPEKFTRLNDSDRHNPRRLIRAIETANQPINVPAPLFQPDEYSLILHSVEPSQLEANLRQRIDQRLERGVLEETQRLITAYPHWNTPAFSATGYQFLCRYLNQEISLVKAKELWFQQERQYAKRQLTWLKKLKLHSISKLPD